MYLALNINKKAQAVTFPGRYRPQQALHHHVPQLGSCMDFPKPGVAGGSPQPGVFASAQVFQSLDAQEPGPPRMEQPLILTPALTRSPSLRDTQVFQPTILPHPPKPMLPSFPTHILPRQVVSNSPEKGARCAYRII